jgi:lipopolysaccharide export system protein LptA
MKEILYKIFLLFVFLLQITNGQTKSKSVTIIGDSLKGKVINGKNIREVIGNVVITKENTKITCNRAIQYLADDIAELIGNVTVTQDSVIIRTEKGRYFNKSELTISDTTVTLKNKKVNLIADRGKYNTSTKIAQFFGNVHFNDSSTTLTSDTLFYYKEEERIIAVGNVKVTDSTSIIEADSLVHLRENKFTFGFGNISIISEENNISIFGNEFIDDKPNKITRIIGNPFLIKIEKQKDGTIDTLFIESKILEAKKDSGNILIAIDSVKIVRNNFSSVNDYTIYNKKTGQITILKKENKPTPVLWYENSQITGDSIYIYLDSNKVKDVQVYSEALLISTDSIYIERYNQISGDSIKMNFTNGKLSNTIVNGNVLSIYYLFEDKEPNGLLKSSAKKLKIIFDDNKVTDVKMYGSPMSEYHPEKLVNGKEKGFTLPTFYLYGNKPEKFLIRKKIKSKTKKQKDKIIKLD